MDFLPLWCPLCRWCGSFYMVALRWGLFQRQAVPWVPPVVHGPNSLSGKGVPSFYLWAPSMEPWPLFLPLGARGTREGFTSGLLCCYPSSPFPATLFHPEITRPVVCTSPAILYADYSQVIRVKLLRGCPPVLLLVVAPIWADIFNNSASFQLRSEALVTPPCRHSYLNLWFSETLTYLALERGGTNFFISNPLCLEGHPLHWSAHSSLLCILLI